MSLMLTTAADLEESVADVAPLDRLRFCLSRDR